jgi:hypothetical protein
MRDEFSGTPTPLASHLDLLRLTSTGSAQIAQHKPFGAAPFYAKGIPSGLFTFYFLLFTFYFLLFTFPPLTFLLFTFYFLLFTFYFLL